MHREDSPVREHQQEAETAVEVLADIIWIFHFLAGDGKFSVAMINACVQAWRTHP